MHFVRWEDFKMRLENQGPALFTSKNMSQAIFLCVSPAHFLIYFECVVFDWHSHSPRSGVLCVFICVLCYALGFLKERSSVQAWKGLFWRWNVPLYCSFCALLFGQSFPCKLKLILVRIHRLLRGWTGLKLSLMLRNICDGWFWLSSRKECIYKHKTRGF